MKIKIRQLTLENISGYHTLIAEIAATLAELSFSARLDAFTSETIVVLL
jgi:hypothetical protein